MHSHGTAQHTASLPSLLLVVPHLPLPLHALLLLVHPAITATAALGHNSSTWLLLLPSKPVASTHTSITAAHNTSLTSLLTTHTSCCIPTLLHPVLPLLLLLLGLLLHVLLLAISTLLTVAAITVIKRPFEFKIVSIL
jgi:hypothetical protein